MGILYGLAAALFWGGGDYLITALTRRSGTVRALILIQAFSLVSWLGLLWTVPGAAHSASGGTAGVWAAAAGAGVCHVLGLVLTYRAFEIGTLSLVSPIASSFAIVTAVLALASGERPPLLTLAGAALLCVGIVLATRAPGDDQKSLAGVPEAIGCAVAFGTMFWMFDSFVVRQLGYVGPLILLKSMALGNALFSSALSRRAAIKAAHQAVPEPAEAISLTHHESHPESAAPAPTPTPASNPGLIWALAIGAAAADTLAWLAWIWGIRTSFATVVTALASLFSVVTVLLAWLLLRERLAPPQWAGVAIILVGVLVVSL